MKPTLKIIIAMVLWGSIGLFVKNISLPSIEIAFLRAVIASIVLIVGRLLIIRNPRKSINKYSKKDIWLLFFSGIILAFNWFFLFKAYKYTTVANATLTYYLAPVFVIFLSPVVFKERITKRKLISVFVAMAGLVLIVSRQKIMLDINYEHIKGITFGVLAAILYAGVIMLNKSIKEVTSFNRTIIQIVISGLVLLPIIIYRDNIDISSTKGLINIIILGTIHTGLAYLLYFPSIKDVSVQRVSVLSYIDSISAIIFGTLFLGEPLGIFHIMGGGLILISPFIKDRT
ncbi:DMT family transporter [Dethiothermospora halolimnae]|uniref:DMT family transporter n=1 Tax=Dethiothermospora halolimnae TaxID=3114390 RepID=UPI003CCB823A